MSSGRTADLDKIINAARVREISHATAVRTASVLKSLTESVVSTKPPKKDVNDSQIPPPPPPPPPLLLFA